MLDEKRFANQEGYHMRIGVNLGPTGDWAAMVAATQQAEKLGYV
jgi:hypothetical protein